MNILITGASDGIGLALARHYQSREARVFAIGRRPADQLDINLRRDYCRVDLLQPFAIAIISTFLQQRQIKQLDLLIHCAGVGSYGPVETQSTSQIDAILTTNLYAPIALTHALLPALKAAHGQIVCIGSVAAALPAPDYAVYAASKAALEGFVRSLRVELHNQVGVQIIHPGATRTGMHSKVGAPLEAIGWQHFPPAEHVARQIARAINHGKPITTIGCTNQILYMAGRHLDSLVDHIATRKANN